MTLCHPNIKIGLLLAGVTDIWHLQLVDEFDFVDSPFESEKVVYGEKRMFSTYSETSIYIGKKKLKLLTKRFFSQFGFYQNFSHNSICLLHVKSAAFLTKFRYIKLIITRLIKKICSLRTRDQQKLHNAKTVPFPTPCTYHDVREKCSSVLLIYM